MVTLRLNHGAMVSIYFRGVCAGAFGIIDCTDEEKPTTEKNL